MVGRPPPFTSFFWKITERIYSVLTSDLTLVSLIKRILSEGSTSIAFIVLGISIDVLDIIFEASLALNIDEGGCVIFLLVPAATEFAA